MDKNEFQNLLKCPAYDKYFHNTDRKLIYMTIAGSYLYGTAIDGQSDVDMRGVVLENKNDMINTVLGCNTFDQAVDDKTDTVVYGLMRIIELLFKCNPNCIELLTPRDSMYYITPEFQFILDNKKDFLSKQAIYSFSGYAIQQLRRLENTLCHDRYDTDRQLKYLNEVLVGTQQHLIKQYNIKQHGDFKIYLKDDMLLLDCNLTNMPLSDMRSAFSELNEIIKTYNKCNSRNKKKDDLHLNKHAMHIIRLYMMALDILERQEIVSYREKEKSLLLDIRHGKFQNSDGTYHSSFFDLVDEYEKKMKYARENTCLPDIPYRTRIYDYLEELIQNTIRGEQ